MNISAKCRACRKAGEKLFIKGEKCNSPACPFTKRSYAPGEAGAKSRKRRGSDYSVQLAEKQKARSIFKISERQMRNYFIEARKTKSATGTKLIRLLESRLDNTVFKIGWFDSRIQARQQIVHGNIYVNAKRIKSPSFQIKPKDVIEAKAKNINEIKKSDVLNWIEMKTAIQATILDLPAKEEIMQPFDEQLIIEYYSR